MIEEILSKAEAWNFVCQCDHHNKCQILPQQKTERWKLLLVADRWMLIVGDVPQINLRPEEALVFLKSRRSHNRQPLEVGLDNGLPK